MSRFNLLDEAWISVMPLDGSGQKDVSLKELFRDAHRYQSLSGDTATQNFAVLRFLLAIVRTVFSRYDVDGAPNPNIELDDRMRQKDRVEEDDLEDQEEFLETTWKGLWKNGEFPEIIQSYLEMWRDRFYLLDEEHPFFQVNKETIRRNFSSDKDYDSLIKGNTHGKFINRLISESENKAALFSPIPVSSGEIRDRMTPAAFARWLITFQAYTGLSDKKKLVPKGEAPSKGWLYDIGGLYLEGRNLFETLVMNDVPAFAGAGDQSEEFVLAVQRPCWESDDEAVVERIRSGERIDNIAELYTNWSRVIYMDPQFDFGSPICFGIAKLPAIDHQDFFLEPMTIWKKYNDGENKGHYLPWKHRPEQAMWRSFGLMTLKNAEDQHRPEIMEQYDRIRQLEGSRWISLNAVSMQDDGNATSWVPVDEITDRLNINDMIITDQNEGGWVVRINDEVQLTKDVIGKTYWRFLKDLETIRGLQQTVFVSEYIEEAYIDIDRPFREWLESLKPEDSIEQQMQGWNSRLKKIMEQEALKMIDNAGNKDFQGVVDKDGHTLNIATAYLKFKNALNKKFA